MQKHQNILKLNLHAKETAPRKKKLHFTPRSKLITKSAGGGRQVSRVRRRPEPNRKHSVSIFRRRRSRRARPAARAATAGEVCARARDEFWVGWRGATGCTSNYPQIMTDIAHLLHRGSDDGTVATDAAGIARARRNCSGVFGKWSIQLYEGRIRTHSCLHARTHARTHARVRVHARQGLGSRSDEYDTTRTRSSHLLPYPSGSNPRPFVRLPPTLIEVSVREP